jgi:cytochrome c peroxidase
MQKEKILTSLVILLFSLLVVVTGMALANGLTPKEQLGKAIFFDNISDPDRMSCATCHGPDAGWTGPVAGINQHGAVYRGAIPTRFGNRKPPSAAYATLSPIFHYDEEEGLFEGGNFWDGRATGEHLGNPAADQALGPFLNPVEQNNPNKQAVCQQIAGSKYAMLWEQVWREPIACSDADIDKNYDRIGLSIAAYEDSSEVNQFSSKYDAYKAGMISLTEEESYGMELFNGKGKCSGCHVMNGEGPNGHDLFTDFTYDNLGVPRNPENPFYDTAGKDWIDEGLGGFLNSLPDQYFTNLNLNRGETVEDNSGKQKVPTLRNLDKRPGDGFPKAYGHNGYFKSIKSIVHFYNTRDVLDKCENPFTTEKDALMMNCWPEPEVIDTVNREELGDLGLTDAEEDVIVAFLKTLSDAYKVKK